MILALTLEKLIESVEDMPSLPQVVTEIIRISEDPNSTPQDVQKLLAQDQVLTAKILRLANSSFYGFARRINTITEATILLGFQTIRSIVFAASVGNFLTKSLDGYQLDQNELWKHSQAVAMTSRYIARQKRFKNPEVFYTAGIIHDIGKLVLNQYLQEDYQKVLSLIYDEGYDFIKAEEAVLGFNHAQTGMKLAEKWNLPPEMVEAIGCHHSPEEATINPTLSSVLHISDSIALMMGFGLGIGGLAYNFSEFALETTGIDGQQIETILPAVTDLMVDKTSFEIF